MKIAISGTHGVGKSTAVYKKAYEYKLKYPDKKLSIVSESARDCPLPINKEASINSQKWMINYQIIKEIEAENTSDIVISDRSIMDYMAYAKYLFPDLFDIYRNLIKNHINTYDKIFYMQVKNNNYLISDGVRDTDPEFQKIIDDTLRNLYEDFKDDIKEIIIE